VVASFDEDFPAVLSIELDRPSPQYIFRWATQPQWVVDTSRQPGETFQMDRYLYFGDDGSLTLDARERQPDETIGTESSRDIPKDKVLIRIAEYTGPGGGDPTNPDKPGHLALSRKRIETAMRNLWGTGQFSDPFDLYMQPVFHESIGAVTLLDDYRRWQDRVYQSLLMRSPHRYNPGGIEDGGTYPSGPPVFSVDDLDNIFEIMRKRNVPTFPDGYYYAIMDDRMFKHLRRDERFREVVSSFGGAYLPMEMVQDPRLFGPGNMPPAMAINYFVQPNQLAFQGPGFNQAMTGKPFDVMPSGVIFNGFRIFTTANSMNEFVTLNYTASTNPTRHQSGVASRRAYLGFFYGKNAIGEAMGAGDDTNMPVRIKRNLNDDYQRFLILIWQTFCGYAVLNEDYVQVARTYAD
jgi:hypothetical protein